MRAATPLARLGLGACRRPLVPRRFASTSGPRAGPSRPAASPFTSSSTPPNASPAARAYQARLDEMYAARMRRNRTIVLYTVGGLALTMGLTYAAVPAYRAFCAATGYAGTPMTDPARFAADRLYATPESRGRQITVRFEATSNDSLPWSFEPVQRSVKVVPGETALAFYTAKNNSDKDLIGIATYNMTPEKIAPYFAKVECFCFEEQKIRAGEEVDLPVFFFIDRDAVDDPTLDNIDDVVLSYTFFRARRNDMGHAIPDAPEDVVQRSQGFENYPSAQPVSS